MRTPQCLCVAVLLLILKFNEVLAFTLSVPSDKIAIGQTFPLSWTSESDDQQNVDICLSTNTQFLRIGSIQRDNALAGKVDVTVNSNISPGTYTLGIRFTGCAFLFAQDLNPFVVTAATPPSTTHDQTSVSSSPPHTISSPPHVTSSPPHTTSRTLITSSPSPTPPTTSSFVKSSPPDVHLSSNSSPQSVVNTGSAASVAPTAPSQTLSQTSSQTTGVDTQTTTSSTPSIISSSGALGKTEYVLGKGTLIPIVGCMFGVLVGVL